MRLSFDNNYLLQQVLPHHRFTRCGHFSVFPGSTPQLTSESLYLRRELPQDTQRASPRSGFAQRPTERAL